MSIKGNRNRNFPSWLYSVQSNCHHYLKQSIPKYQASNKPKQKIGEKNMIRLNGAAANTAIAIRRNQLTDDVFVSFPFHPDYSIRCKLTDFFSFPVEKIVRSTICTIHPIMIYNFVKKNYLSIFVSVIFINWNNTTAARHIYESTELFYAIRVRE